MSVPEPGWLDFVSAVFVAPRSDELARRLRGRSGSWAIFRHAGVAVDGPYKGEIVYATPPSWSLAQVPATYLQEVEVVPQSEGRAAWAKVTRALHSPFGPKSSAGR